MFKTRVKKRVDITSEEYDDLFDTIVDEKNLIDMYKPGEKIPDVGKLKKEGEETIDTEMLFMTGTEIAEKYKEDIEIKGTVDYVKGGKKEVEELGQFGTYIVGIVMVTGFTYFLYKVLTIIK